MESSPLKISTIELRRIQELAYKHASITISDTKGEFISSRVAKRMRNLGLGSVDEYFNRVEDGQESIESFTNIITTNYTHFFREKHHFYSMVNHAKSLRPERCTIWSSACSSGEEVYSIVFSLLEYVPSFMHSNIEIIASDLDTDVLEKARSGIYKIEALKDISDKQMSQYFTKGINKNEGLVRVKKPLRDKVTFKKINLGQSLEIDGRVNILFCRNVMIYFDDIIKRNLFEKFADLQKPGDLLLLGHSESIGNLSRGYKCVGKTTYVRC